MLGDYKDLGLSAEVVRSFDETSVTGKRTGGVTVTATLLDVKQVARLLHVLDFQQLGEPALRSTDNPNSLNRWGFDTVESEPDLLPKKQ
jgi:hypothetical protein